MQLRILAESGGKQTSLKACSVSAWNSFVALKAH